MQFQLDSHSIVVVANTHNPSIVTEEFLTSKCGIPNDWSVKSTLALPGITRIQFNNKVEWNVDNQRLLVKKDEDVPFGDFSNGEIFEMVKKYVDTLNYVNYQAFGLNFDVSIKQNDPKRWIAAKLLRNGTLEGKFAFIPKFIAQVDDTTKLLLDFIDDSDFVKIACNVHHEGPLTEGWSDKILSWQAAKDATLDGLNKILGD